MKELYLSCDCRTIEHTVRFTGEPDIECVILDLHLIKLPFWQRVIYAVKYIFGYGSQYGAFQEVLLDVEKIEALKEFLEQSVKEINGEC